MGAEAGCEVHIAVYDIIEAGIGARGPVASVLE
jgi:hypothetical protein